MKRVGMLVFGVLKLVGALVVLVIILGFASLISQKALMVAGGIVAASAFAVIFSKEAAATKTNKAIAGVVFILAALMAFGGYLEGQKEQEPGSRRRCPTRGGTWQSCPINALITLLGAPAL